MTKFIKSNFDCRFCGESREWIEESDKGNQYTVAMSCKCCQNCGTQEKCDCCTCWWWNGTAECLPPCPQAKKEKENG